MSQTVWRQGCSVFLAPGSATRIKDTPPTPPLKVPEKHCRNFHFPLEMYGRMYELFSNDNFCNIMIKLKGLSLPVPAYYATYM